MRAAVEEAMALVTAKETEVNELKKELDQAKAQVFDHTVAA